MRASQRSARFIGGPLDGQTRSACASFYVHQIANDVLAPEAGTLARYRRVRIGHNSDPPWEYRLERELKALLEDRAKMGAPLDVEVKAP